jgi:hypothetical protein
VTSQRKAVHEYREAVAIALKDNVKQSATAATSRSSGDHSLPDPPNSVGGPDTNVGRPSAVKSTSCSGVAVALTEYWCAMAVFTFSEYRRGL